MRGFEVMELAELIDWLWTEKVELCLEVGLERGLLLLFDRALVRRVGESGGVRGRFCEDGGSWEGCWDLDCAFGECGVNGRGEV